MLTKNRTLIRDTENSKELQEKQDREAPLTPGLKRARREGKSLWEPHFTRLRSRPLWRVGAVVHWMSEKSAEGCRLGLEGRKQLGGVPNSGLCVPLSLPIIQQKKTKLAAVVQAAIPFVQEGNEKHGKEEEKLLSQAWFFHHPLCQYSEHCARWKPRSTADKSPAPVSQSREERAGFWAESL